MATKKVNIDIIAKDKTRQAMKSASTGLDNLKKSVFSLQTALIGIGGSLVAKSFLDTARETERLQVRFKFLFDDVREGEKAFRGLTEFASKVPFSLEEIQRGAGNLAVVSQSAEEMNRLLAITGDLAVASGLDFQTTAEQIQRTFSSGINSADLFRERGVREMLGFEAGVAISAEKSKQHIIDIFQEGSKSFVGGSQVMADTFDGVISMIGDKVRLFKQDVMDAGPFEALKGSAQLLDQALVKNFGSIEKSAEMVGDAIVGTTVKTILFASEVIDTFQPVFKFLGDSVANLVNFVRGLPPPIDSLGVIGFLMLGKKGKLAVGIIASQIDRIRGMLASLIDVEIKMQETMKAIIPDFIEGDSIDKSLVQLKKRAEELRKPFKDVADELDETGEKAKLVFPSIGVEIDRARVREEGFTGAFLDQLEVLDKILKKNKERNLGMSPFGMGGKIEQSHKKQTDAVKETTKATLSLAEAEKSRLSALEAVEMALGRHESQIGLFANFANGFKEVAESQKEMFKQMQDIGASTFDKLKTSLTDFVMTGKLSFQDLGTFVVRSMVDMLIGEAIKNAMKGSLAMFKADSIKKAFISLYEGAMKTFASIPFPFNVGAVGGAIAFGTGLINKIRGFEKGGRPPVGQPSIVGEKGAELFVPDQAGTVVPNDKLGMNQNVTVNFNINTVDARGFNELLVNSRGVIVNLINSAMNEKGKMAVV
ncbi:phage tail tape measure C-terminal domain-containing protein [Hyphomonas sp.]|uniref:phage tail tape measure C-terminal domain-containing protein n=1 Tax=Hyphomonas sp. TaxID=87 RepID=UPI000C90979A|nr:phage tail tape measure C-terminal domain-containing protein [Hyphomonas sp.]MAL46673.1 hypothetical protein [Hyphomonas sp.]